MQKLVGTTLAHYRIDKVLGRGGMGWVFLGFNTKLDNYVAIKVMNPTFSHDENYIQRFIGEAKRAASLKHPGIVTVHDHGEADGYLYIVMEYIEGGNLHEKLKEEKTLPLPEVITLVKEICDALYFAHEKGILHRDIKPENIMIENQATDRLPYRLVITDLGLSKSVDSNLTKTGDSMGTLTYASPEQALGKPVAATTDIYSLGLVCYELLVGQSLFDFDSFSAAMRFHHKEEPRPKFDPSLPREIEPIIQKCLERDPLARYQTVRELAEALTNIGAEPNLDDTRVPPPTRPPNREESDDKEPDTDDRSAWGGIVDEIKGFFASGLTEEPTEGRDNIQILSSNKTNYFAIEQDIVTIGRDRRNDLRLTGADVAPHHARLERSGDGYQIIALHNEYVIRLGDTPLQPHKPQLWSQHDLLHLGAYHLWLMPGQSQEQSAQKKESIISNKREKIGIGVDKQTIMCVVNPGSRVAEKLKLTNRGDIVDHFMIRVKGINEAWVQLPTDLPIELNPDKDRSVEIAFQPPRVPESRAGDYDFIVEVTSSRDPSARLEIPGKLTVNPYYDFKLDMRPLKQEGGTAGNFDVHLNNKSNTDIAMHMQARDPEDACDYIFDPEYITVHAAAKQIVDLTVRPQGKLVRQGSRSYHFTVTAEPEHLTEQDIPESYRQIRGEWVHAPPQFDLKLEPASQSSVAEGHFAVIIDNKVHFDITVQLSATDPRRQCDYIFEEEEVRIPVGEDRQVQMRVVPNTPLPGTKPREVAFTVTARPKKARQLRTDIRGRWEQIPPPFDFTLFPQTYTSEDRGRFTVRVLNQSDADLAFNVAGRVTDKKGQYTLDFEKTHIEVAAGDTRTIPLRVRPNLPLPRGESRLYPFAVRAWPDIAPRVIHERGGEWLQSKHIGCWFWISWVFAIFICLIITALGGYAVCYGLTDIVIGETVTTHLDLMTYCVLGFDGISLSTISVWLLGLIVTSFVSWQFWEDRKISCGTTFMLTLLAIIPISVMALYAMRTWVDNPNFLGNLEERISEFIIWLDSILR